MFPKFFKLIIIVIIWMSLGQKKVPHKKTTVMLSLKGKVPVNSNDSAAIDRNQESRKHFFIVRKH